MATLKKIRRAIRAPFETGGFKVLELLIPLLPRGAVVRLSKLAGTLAWRLPLREKQIGMKNLDAVFGDSKTAAEKRMILTSSFSTFCLTMLDVFWFAKNSKKRLLKYVEIDPSFEPFFEQKARICITAHFGSWEVLAQCAALRGTDLASIAATVKNNRVDALLRRLREKTGQTIIPQKGALRTLIARLRKEGSVGFVLDQNTNEREGGIIVNFMGLPMSVSSAPAASAYRTGTEIRLGFCLPQPNGKYRAYSPGTLQPLAFDKEQNTDQVVSALTQTIQNMVSKEIREHPEYWLWSYKHWRRSPGKTYPPNYPDY